MTGAVVLDIEGTTSSTAQVHDVLSPYARRRVADRVAAHRGSPEVRRILSDVARTPVLTVHDDGAAVRVLERWSDDGRKAGPLKRLQGLIWSEGYARGELSGHVHPDTVEALALWQERGVRVHACSSGDLRGRLTHHFDTVAELDAARLADWCTALVRRPQEPSGPVEVQGDGHRHPVHPDLVSVARGRAR
ncbi:hypothetical protein [Streptomyces sp. 4F14]|uniref:hypothetical protein n=1 Tax=Streptomyces sp. 4F14 TaxID=3394380 RepID=UPI003A885D39